MTDVEVISQLRLHSIEDLNRGQRAYIEPNGVVSVVLREPPSASETPRSPQL